MPKKRKAKQRSLKSVHLSIRIPGENAARIGLVAVETGWPVNRTIGWLADLAIKVLRNPKHDASAERDIFRQWCEHHRIEQQAQRKIAASKSMLRRVLNDNKETPEPPGVLTQELKKE